MKGRRPSATGAVPRPRGAGAVAIGTIAAALAWSAPAFGAGGHHSVDDAALLEPQQCQLESWIERERGGGRTLLHTGPACRVGPVEIGLNLDRVRLRDDGTSHVAGVQLKWARPLAGGWSVGTVLSAARQDRTPRAAGSSLVLPVSWQASETLLAHVNVGRDFRPGQPDSNRAGAALEWTPLPAWSGVAERYRESGANFRRFALRWSATPAISVDVGHARGFGDDAGASWTVGLNWVWD